MAEAGGIQEIVNQAAIHADTGCPVQCLPQVFVYHCFLINQVFSL